VVPLTDGQAAPVTEGDTLNLSPSWSPDSQSLYFVSNQGGSMDLWQRTLTADGTPTGASQRLTTGVEMLYARFSPGGNRLVYSKGRRLGNLWRVPILKNHPATWSEAQQLTDQQSWPDHVSLSPDGKQLLFCLRGPEGVHIWKMPADGGDPERVLMGPSDQVWARWSPDGQTIAFQSGLDIWVVPENGGPASRLTEHEAIDVNPEWSPDGREIAFNSSRSGNVDVWILPAQGGEARQLTDDPADDFVATPWSPDGRRVAFISSRSGNLDIWVAPTEGGEPRQLTSDPAPDGQPYWSPDGKWVLFSSGRGGGTVWRVPVEGGEPEPILEDGWSPVRSPGGDSLYFAAQPEGRGNLFEKEFGRRAERQLTDFAGRPGFLDFLNDTDGEFLYFTWSEDFGDLWVMDVEQQGAASR
jgi:TolB protein